MIIRYNNREFYSIDEIRTAVDIASGDDGRLGKEVQDVLTAFLREIEKTDERVGLYKNIPKTYSRSEKEDLLYDSNPGLEYTRKDYSKMSNKQIDDLWTEMEMDKHLESLED